MLAARGLRRHGNAVELAPCLSAGRSYLDLVVAHEQPLWDAGAFQLAARREE